MWSPQINILGTCSSRATSACRLWPWSQGLTLQSGVTGALWPQGFCVSQRWCVCGVTQPLPGGREGLLKVGYDSTAGSPFSVMGGLHKVVWPLGLSS